MNIKRLVVVALMVLVSCAMASAATPSTVAKGQPLNSQDSAITGYAALSTPTLTLTSYAQQMPAMPAGTVEVTVIASGALNYGGSDVKTSTDGKFQTLADAGTKTFKIYGPTPRPEIYFCVNATGAANVNVRFVPGVQR